MELRFSPTRPWDHFPGIFSERFNPRGYTHEVDTGLGNIPAEIRDQNPALMHQPLKKLKGPMFTILYGPRTVALATNEFQYPGWDNFWPEMESVLSVVTEMKLTNEVSRLGLRYINAFDGDIYGKLSLQMTIRDKPFSNPQTGLSLVVPKDGFQNLIQITNHAGVVKAGRPQLMSVLDIDTTFNASDSGLLEKAPEVFKKAHVIEKALFFGLLKKAFVDTLRPKYENGDR